MDVFRTVITSFFYDSGTISRTCAFTVSSGATGEDLGKICGSFSAGPAITCYRLSPVQNSSGTARQVPTVRELWPTFLFYVMLTIVIAHGYDNEVALTSAIIPVWGSYGAACMFFCVETSNGEADDVAVVCDKVNRPIRRGAFSMDKSVFR